MKILSTLWRLNSLLGTCMRSRRLYHVHQRLYNYKEVQEQLSTAFGMALVLSSPLIRVYLGTITDRCYPIVYRSAELCCTTKEKRWVQVRTSLGMVLKSIGTGIIVMLTRSGHSNRQRRHKYRITPHRCARPKRAPWIQRVSGDVPPSVEVAPDSIVTTSCAQIWTGMAFHCIWAPPNALTPNSCTRRRYESGHRRPETPQSHPPTWLPFMRHTTPL